MIKNVKLKSGVRIVMEYLPYVESVVTGIWFATGAANEDEMYSGISHYVEHMMFKGTETRSAKQIAEDIDKTGGQINAFTGKEATCYYVRSVSSCFEENADVLCDMLTSSVFDETEMDRERQVILEEIKMTQDTPDDLAHDTIMEMVFAHNDLGKSITGDKDSLYRINSNVMKKYINEYYARNGIVISVAGNFQEDRVLEYFENKFDKFREAPLDYNKRQGIYKPTYKNIVKDIEQSHICLASPGIEIEDPRYYSLSILNNVIGGSMSSRLFQNIREERGLAYSVYSMASSYGRGGYFNIYVGCNTEKAAEAMKGIKEELDKIKKEGITQEELDSSRAQMKASYIFGEENVAGRMFKNGKNMVISNCIHEPSEIIKAYDNVTMEDIENVKSIICDYDNYSACVISNRDMDIERILKSI